MTVSVSYRGQGARGGVHESLEVRRRQGAAPRDHRGDPAGRLEVSPSPERRRRGRMKVVTCVCARIRKTARARSRSTLIVRFIARSRPFTDRKRRTGTTRMDRFVVFGIENTSCELLRVCSSGEKAIRRRSRQVSSLARGEHVDVDLALRDLSLVLVDARRERLHLVRARVLRRGGRRRRRGLLGVSSRGTEHGSHSDPGDAAPGAPRHALRDHAHEPAGHAAAGLLLVRGRGSAARRTRGGRARARRCEEKGREGVSHQWYSFEGDRISPTRRRSNDGVLAWNASRAYQACVHHHRHRGDPFRSSWSVVELRGAGDCGDAAGGSTRETKSRGN